MLASSRPVTGCSTTAEAVNTKSAITTIRATPAMTATLRLRCATSMKKAMPAPVPSSTAAPMMCTNLRKRYQVTGFRATSIFHDSDSDQEQHHDRPDFHHRAERIRPQPRQEKGTGDHVRCRQGEGCI